VEVVNRGELTILQNGCHDTQQNDSQNNDTQHDNK
jgi:hypothetical protein